MAIPPFPSQDLAKLVLGYLAEEQLMTAYDEFLQASPYLDALRNEYDRIFMTSLKNILAEYRAVKIYVETCKPFILRRRLFQCANLFEIVKLLVQNVDINKLTSQEQNVDKSSSHPLNTCKSSISQIEATTLENSVETTSLADLPGNVTTKKKSIKSIDRDHSSDQSVIHSVIENETKHVTTCYTGLCSDNDNPVPQLVVNEDKVQNDVQKMDNNPQDAMIKSKKPESAQKIDEFNNILEFVRKNGNDSSNKALPASDDVIGQQQRILTAGTFKDFTTGINNENIPDPSASTSAEGINAQAPFRRNINTFVNMGMINGADLKSKSPLMLKVGCIKNKHGVPVLTTELNSQKDDKPSTHNTNVTREENKIKILSDIKVDKSYENICVRPKMLPPLSNNATSTPHIQIPTVLMNSTLAYRHKPQTSLNYTKDEIMAMPTIILVSATESKSSITETHSTITLPTNNNIMTATSCAENIMKPLVIDVTSNVKSPDMDSEKNPTRKIEQKALNEQSLVKTVEVTGHVSVPKDNSMLTSLKTNTPQGLPPKRKSSSTPRRTSHVRVLDFTTPRRILHETINEQGSNNNSSAETEHKEITDPVRKEIEEANNNSTLLENVSNTNANMKSNAAKENKVILNKKNNWDADLRALVAKDTYTDTSNKSVQKSKSKTKSVNSKKKNSDNKVTDKAIEENSKTEKKTKKSLSKAKVNKNKKAKDIQGEDDVTYENKETVSVAVKPNINIITNNEWSTNHENDKSQNKCNTSHDRTDTPESERIALQNAIGAKLNLSDLLETPYKQALYDIQMDTPKYLGPDLPDEPISDVKIMSIPTPRFLCSPKGDQATPSSYSSRPTDYSSGSSYYKPDCQDYIMSTEALGGPFDTPENIKTSERCEKLSNKLETCSKNEEPKSRRPVRQCRKNVSYYTTQNSKYKEPESKDNVEYSDSTNINSSLDKSDNAINSKKMREARRKSDSKKNITLKKSKSPKTFMKIKPRRTTPIKEHIGSKSRKHSESSQHKSQKRTSSKDNSNITPVAASVPTKSRRKSSTPRKLHCTKTFDSQRSENVSPEYIKSKESIAKDNQVVSHDSDIEQLPLRWSDDGSQDGKSQDTQLNLESVNDGDDISKIKEYIETSVSEQSARPKVGDGSLHIDLIKRGFDIETAKIIERDLLDSPRSKQETTSDVVDLERLDVKNDVSVENNSARTISDASGNLEIVDIDDDNDEVEFSMHECNEDTENFINYEFVESSHEAISQPATLKDNFSMEICIDDGVTVRLRATTFSMLLDQNPERVDVGYPCKETEIAVSSISHIDKLYTPMKDAKAQIYEIFDSTLTSLDTPFKATGRKSHESEPIITEIELEVEKVDYKEKVDVKKRKHLQSSSTLEDSPHCSKRPKPDTQYLLNTANIQNIDIESVLSKLHGP